MKLSFKKCIRAMLGDRNYEFMKRYYNKYLGFIYAYYKYGHTIIAPFYMCENFFMTMCAKKAGGYYSQFGQDFFIANTIFNGKKDGIFLDVGANDPVKINNTYYFEKIGWTGIAFEPIPQLAEKYNSARTTHCYQNAVGSEKKTVFFSEDYEFNYLSQIVKARTEKSYAVEQVRISDICKENGIEHIDFMSLDVEDYEEEAINGIDFSELTIDLICVENNHKYHKSPDPKLRKFIESKGYILDCLY